jgi:phytanoyl-CoA dioxygenase PhyH
MTDVSALDVTDVPAVLRPLTEEQTRYFHTFGHALLPAALEPATTAALFDEVRAEVARAYPDTDAPPAGDDGVAGYFLAAMTARTPTSLALVRALAPVAAELLGVDAVVPVYADVTVFFGSTPWHTDIGMPIPFVKFGTYADRLTAANGALRFVPGSHRDPLCSDLKAMVRELEVTRGLSIEDAVSAVPHTVLDMAPGDVVAIDGKVWHATAGGRRRLQWSLPFVAATDEALARRFFDSFVVETSARGYDGRQFPFYGEEFLRTELGERLRRIGASDIARARETAP